jgi:hypothetical protein
MRIQIQLITSMRIQVTKMMRIHADPDPQHLITTELIYILTWTCR